MNQSTALASTPLAASASVPDFRHHLDRELEHGGAVHAHERRASDLTSGKRARNAEDVPITAVRVQVRGSDPRHPRRHQHDRACAVTEQHAGSAVTPVEDARIDLRADDERVARHSRRDHAIGQSERIDESAAHGLDVEGRSARRAELGLEDARRRGKDHVRGGRRDDDEIDVGRRNPRGAEGGPRRMLGEVAGHLRGRRDPALADAGARADPRVAGVDALREIVVGEDVRRQITAGPDDATMHR